MSSEMIEIVRMMDKEELNTQLALQCAPLLAGLKISNLLIICKANTSDVFALFANTQISCTIVCETAEKVTFLLYDRKLLQAYLAKREVAKLFLDAGYQSMDLDEIFREFYVRYTAYMHTGMAFPHEMGALLGYPIDDITGFIKNNGKKFLHVGYWKVYGNLDETLQLFEQFNQATERIMKEVSRGRSVQSILAAQR